MTTDIGKQEKSTDNIETALQETHICAQDSGEDMQESKIESSVFASVNEKCPPPSPGTPPPMLSRTGDDKANTPQSALFAAINAAGSDISKVLKKSDKAVERNGCSTTTEAPSRKPQNAHDAKTTLKASQASGVPKCSLKGGKTWEIEYQSSNRDLSIEVTDKKQSVYIYCCENSLIKINQKCNSITVDSCKKCDVIFESVLSTCTVVNCNSLQLQVNKQAPSIAVDKTDGLNVFLPSAVVSETQIVTAKSSSVNVTVINDEEDPVEVPLPEQFVNKYINGRWITEPVRHE
eukprot:jgi/Galph1/4992/GphlegSOOS_G3652.1